MTVRELWDYAKQHGAQDSQVVFEGDDFVLSPFIDTARYERRKIIIGIRGCKKVMVQDLF